METAFTAARLQSAIARFRAGVLIMHVRKRIILLVLFSALAALSALNFTRVSADVMTNVDAGEYRANITGTIPMGVRELENGIESRRTFVVFFGRESCPYCKEFSRTLRTFLDETGVPVGYFDTSKVSPQDVDGKFLDMMSNVVGPDATLEGLMTLTKYRYQ